LELITYSIKNELKNSQLYYQEVRTFTEIVIAKSVDSLMPIANEYMEYIQLYKLEPLREMEEYILELLSFGVLWKVYAAKALQVKRAPFVTMSQMGEWRKKHQWTKPAIDFVRGIFLTMFLLPRKVEVQRTNIPTLEQVDHVCKWFEATGEFREQALRFIRWRAFWGTKKPEELTKIFSKIRAFTKWFEESSEIVLGKYTGNVDNFIQHSQQHYQWREDQISCMRNRLEYHLNMVGAELMNQAFKTEFDASQIKAVLVPGCMRENPNDECKAVRVKEGLICQGCVSSCHVNQLREMGKKNNFDVYIIPHASDLSLWSPKKDQPKRGVVASACVTTLVEGGWELKRYDVPAQCVLLDFCGCKKHWHKKGFPTELNIRELKRILSTNR
jgi:hypothetical protein